MANITLNKFHCHPLVVKRHAGEGRYPEKLWGHKIDYIYLQIEEMGLFIEPHLQ